MTGSKASEVGANYTKLAYLLTQKKMRWADRETVEKILQVAGKQKSGEMEVEDIQQFPCRDLRTINELWLASSNGKFGLTSQREIYNLIRSELQKNLERNVYLTSDTFKRFAEQVEWKPPDKPFLYDEDELPINPEGVKGHLPRYYVKLKVARCCREVVLGTLCFLCPSPLSAAPEAMAEFLDRTQTCNL
ncbi:MAG: GUN4 domain-containing protein [Cyanobacteriota bacterium]|nr:GUN4 domain-containing protein [Cyanobacteriota bacterium]